MTPLGWTNAFWLWLGPTDEPLVNAFSAMALAGALLWVGLPFVLWWLSGTKR